MTTKPPPIIRARIRVLRALLRTPAHPTVSRRFMLLTGVDGADVRPTIPLRYADHEQQRIVMARPGSTWWADLSAETPTACTVRFKGRTQTLDAILAAGEALDQAVLRYLQKYPGEWKSLGVDARATAEDIEAAARGQAVIIFTTT